MKTIVTFIVLFVLICFGSVCLSQLFDRSSLSHYLCLASGLLSLAAASRWVWKLDDHVYGKNWDE